MNKIVQGILVGLYNLILRAIKLDVRGESLTKKGDKIMDEKFGDLMSEKTQREAVFPFTLGMQRGIFDENPRELVEAWRKAAEKLENDIAGGY